MHVIYSHFRYVHLGSEDSLDQFEIMASDGEQQASQAIYIQIQPINDQLPEIPVNLQTQVTINEGGEFLVTPEILRATDVDTNDMLLHFIVVDPPKRGILVKNGVTTTRFRQMDITEGEWCWGVTLALEGSTWMCRPQRPLFQYK